jgi:hypothetical protein
MRGGFEWRIAVKLGEGVLKEGNDLVHESRSCITLDRQRVNTYLAD